MRVKLEGPGRGLNPGPLAICVQGVTLSENHTTRPPRLLLVDVVGGENGVFDGIGNVFRCLSDETATSTSPPSLPYRRVLLNMQINAPGQRFLHT